MDEFQLRRELRSVAKGPGPKCRQRARSLRRPGAWLAVTSALGAIATACGAIAAAFGAIAAAFEATAPTFEAIAPAFEATPPALGAVATAPTAPGPATLPFPSPRLPVTLPP